MFLKILQNSQENNCARVSFSINLNRVPKWGIQLGHLSEQFSKLMTRLSLYCSWQAKDLLKISIIDLFLIKTLKKGVLKNFAKFTGKQLCQSLNGTSECLNGVANWALIWTVAKINHQTTFLLPLESQRSLVFLGTVYSNEKCH